jgi:hypothetical protein
MDGSYIDRVLLKGVGYSALTIVSQAERLCDDGKLYGISYIATTPGTSTSYLSFTTGPAVNTHTQVSFYSTGTEIIRFYAAPTITVAGSLIPIYNFHLVKPINTAAVARSGVSVSSTGLKFAEYLLTGGSGGNALGGAIVSGREVILPANTTYLFEIDNDTSQEHLTEVTMAFYEYPVGY